MFLCPSLVAARARRNPNQDDFLHVERIESRHRGTLHRPERPDGSRPSGRRGKVASPAHAAAHGAVAYDAFKPRPFSRPSAGRSTKFWSRPGETVHAGQPLLTVNSPDYSAARSTYIKARDAYLLADKFYIRAQDLLSHGAIAESDFQQAESTRTQAHADLRIHRGRSPRPRAQ